MLRRNFIKLSSSFVVTASLPGALSGCFHRGNADGSAAFSAGIASGDPRPTSVVLWTRVAPDVARFSLRVTAQLALDEQFNMLVLEEALTVSEDSDYTLRVLVENLQPDTFYYYRFITEFNQSSRTGRTLTAPLSTSTIDIPFAVVSCQNRRHGFYSAYRKMIDDDVVAPLDEQIRFVLHLGDFIYETIDDPLQMPLDSLLNPLPQQELVHANGRTRRISALPDGVTNQSGVTYANTVNDYRHLYQQYLLDPDLQAARARWPLIPMWDDHEFSDDSWQSEANYNSSGSTDEPSQPRKVAANQAWFEYMPVNLSQLGDIDTDLQHATEFSFASVAESENSQTNNDNFAINEDNINAVATLTNYRSFRFGQCLELILTDNRSYRSDHALPEEISDIQPGFVHPRVAMPLELINELDAGGTANSGDPDLFVNAGGPVINPRFSSPPGTILGARQKEWWKETLRSSSARWKLWANSVPLMRLLANLSDLNVGLPDIVFSADTWDGYATERNELMSYLVDNEIRNVISLSGDIHAHLAGIVMDNYDTAPAAMRPAAVELVCGAVSSISMFAAVENLSRRNSPTALEQLLRDLITYDDRQTTSAGDNPIVNNLNNTLLNGVNSALAAVASNSALDIAAVRDPAHNRHLVYADTDAHGYMLVTATQNAVTGTLVTLSGIINDPVVESPAIERSTEIEIPYATTGQPPSISEISTTGRPLFPI